MKIIIVGGDERQYFLYKELKKDIPNITLSYIEKIYKSSKLVADFNEYDIIILPMPVSKNNLTVNTPFSKETVNLKNLFTIKNKLIIGGKIPETLYKTLSKNNTLFDYSESEKLLLKNAILTSEAAISIAIEKSKSSLAFKKILVIGNGRIGKTLSHMLSNFYSEIYVSARNRLDYNNIIANNFKYINTYNIKDYISEFDYIFNTVPKKILTEDIISLCKNDCLITDLASAPGGVDTDACKKHKIKAIQALALPGKYSPISAANVIKEEILPLILNR